MQIDPHRAWRGAHLPIDDRHRGAASDRLGDEPVAQRRAQPRPFSAFTFVSQKPPMLAISVGRKGADYKDTRTTSSIPRNM